MESKQIQTFIESAYRQGKMPTAPLLSKWTKVDLVRAEEEIEKWKSQKESIKQQTATQEPVQKKSAVKHLHIHSLSTEAIKFLCLVISILAMVRSFGYVMAWFPTQDFMTIVTSATVILAYTVFPQAAIAVWKKNKAVFVSLMTISLIVILFSMGATVNALWNERTAKLNQEVQIGKVDEDRRAAIISKSAEAKRLDDQRGLLMAEVQTLTAQRNKEEALSAAYNRLDSKMVNARNKLEATEKQIQAVSQDLEKLRAQTSAVERKDFLQTSNLEIYFYIALSIIVDLAGPVALSVALFL